MIDCAVILLLCIGYSVSLINLSLINVNGSLFQGAIPMVAGAVTVGALAIAAYNGFKSLQG